MHRQGVIYIVGFGLLVLGIGSLSASPAVPIPTLEAPSAPDVSPRGRHTCKPNCHKKTCGSDGCGGSCGRCGKGQVCYVDRCAKRPKDPCLAMTGTWVGAMRLNQTYGLRGRVWRTPSGCVARFVITYVTNRGQPGSATEDFQVLFPGHQVYFKGVRIVRSSSGYLLDNFKGMADYQRGRFQGRFWSKQTLSGRVDLSKK